MSSPKKISCAALLAGMLLSVPAVGLAEGLGDLRVNSYLGEVFRAEIDVLGMRPTFAAECVVLDPTLRDPESGLPRLRDAFVTLDAAAHKLLITSRQRISDPALHLSLTLACGSYLTRNYVALLSPREMGTAATVGGAAPQAAAVPKPVAPAAGVLRPARTARAAGSSRSSSAVAASATAEAKGAPATPAAASPAPAAPSGARLELSPPTVELEQVEKEIAALNAELRRLSEGSDAQSAEVQTRILEMETRLVRMELRAARARLQAVSAGAGVAAGEAPPAAVPAPSIVAEPPAATSPPPTVSAPVPAPAQAPRRVESDDSGSGMWAGLAVLLLFAAALVAYLLRRSARRGDTPVTTAPKVAVVTPRAASAPAAAVTAAPPTPAATPAQFPAPPPEFAADTADALELPPEAEVVKLAEVMSAFGRTEGAIDALRTFIREHPDRAVQPTLCLLKLYKEHGQREAFEALATSLRGDSKFGRLHWEDPVEDIQRLLSAAGH